MPMNTTIFNYTFFGHSKTTKMKILLSKTYLKQIFDSVATLVALQKRLG